MPKLSRGGTPKPFKARRPSLPVPDVKPPKILADLYADLRDRRLLPLVAVLLVAIVVAPIALGGSGGEEDEIAPPITATAGATPSDASFSVVPAEPGLRDYRRRLSLRRARDPFRQPAPANTVPSSGSSSSSESNSGTSAATEAKSGQVVVEGGGMTPVEPEASEAGTGTAPSPVETTPSPTEAESAPPVNKSETTHSVVVEKEVTGYAVDIHAGFLGHRTDQNEVAAMTQLPTRKQPIIVYLGPSQDQKGALFLMSSEVTAFYGKGHCTLDKGSCTVLELRPGKSATFEYGIERKRYKLTLLSIAPQISTHEASSTVTRTHRH